MNDAELALAAMCRDRDVVLEQLAGSASGSAVYRVSSGVVKVTTAQAWREAARRELWCYRELRGRLPVAMPELLDWVDTDEVTAILLSAHRPARSAAAWSEPEWLELARQLGALHTTEARLDRTGDWLPGVLSAPPRPDAVAYWQLTDAAGAADAVLSQGPRLAAVLAAADRCVVHGDCHVGNLLQGSDGELVWTDWQGVGEGIGAAELAFLWARAVVDAEPPREAMLETYARARGVDVEQVRRVSLAVELGTIAFAFPEYAVHNSAQQRDRLTRRLIRLRADWEQAMR